jgi:hypothetical protein
VNDSDCLGKNYFQLEVELTRWCDRTKALPPSAANAALHASLIFALAAKSASYTRDALVVSIGMHFYVSTTTY